MIFLKSILLFSGWDYEVPGKDFNSIGNSRIILKYNHYYYYYYFHPYPAQIPFSKYSFLSKTNIVEIDTATLLTMSFVELSRCGTRANNQS